MPVQQPNLGPSIMVKQKDGTIKRVPLNEFRKQRGGAFVAERKSTVQPQEVMLQKEDQAQVKPIIEIKMPAEETIAHNDNTKIDDKLEKVEVTQPKREDTLHMSVNHSISNLPRINEHHELSTTTPVTDIFVDEAKYVRTYEQSTKVRTTKGQATDFSDRSSLLEEDVSEVSRIAPKHTTLDVRKKVPLNMSVYVSDDLMPRLNSLIVSFEKGIRNKDQFLAYAMRDVAHGGLGLSADQATDLFISTTQSGRGSVTQALKKEVVVAPLLRSSVVLEKSIQTQNPPTPVEKYHDMTPHEIARPVYRASAYPKNIMQEVSHPASVTETMGPHEEIGKFSLVDFRRLSKDPIKAREMLLEKFNGWKQESYVLYMDTRRSWFESPLYAQYRAVIEKALSQIVPVSEILRTDNIMTLSEFTALVEVNHALEV